jgi:hypothetical protein
MTEFMLLAVRSVAAGGSDGGGGGGEEAAAAAATAGEAALAAPPRAKVAVIQFSNDVRVEQVGGPLAGWLGGVCHVPASHPGQQAQA